MKCRCLFFFNRTVKMIFSRNHGPWWFQVNGYCHFGSYKNKLVQAKTIWIPVDPDNTLRSYELKRSVCARNCYLTFTTIVVSPISVLLLHYKQNIQQAHLSHAHTSLWERKHTLQTVCGLQVIMLCSVSCTDQSFHFIRHQCIVRSHRYSFCFVCICFLTFKLTVAVDLHFMIQQGPQLQLK